MGVAKAAMLVDLSWGYFPYSASGVKRCASLDITQKQFKTVPFFLIACIVVSFGIQL